MIVSKNALSSQWLLSLLVDNSQLFGISLENSLKYRNIFVVIVVVLVVFFSFLNVPFGTVLDVSESVHSGIHQIGAIRSASVFILGSFKHIQLMCGNECLE